MLAQDARSWRGAGTSDRVPKAGRGKEGVEGGAELTCKQNRGATRLNEGKGPRFILAHNRAQAFVCQNGSVTIQISS